MILINYILLYLKKLKWVNWVRSSIYGDLIWVWTSCQKSGFGVGPVKKTYWLTQALVRPAINPNRNIDTPWYKLELDYPVTKFINWRLREVGKKFEMCS